MSQVIKVSLQSVNLRDAWGLSLLKLALAQMRAMQLLLKCGDPIVSLFVFNGECLNGLIQPLSLKASSSVVAQDVLFLHLKGS